MSDAPLPDGITVEHVAILQAMAAGNASLCLSQDGDRAWISGRDRDGQIIRYPMLPIRLEVEGLIRNGLVRDPEDDPRLRVHDLTEAGRAMAEAVPVIKTKTDLKTALTPKRDEPQSALLDAESQAFARDLASLRASRRKGSPRVRIDSAVACIPLSREDRELVRRDDARRATERSRAPICDLLARIPGVRGAQLQPESDSIDLQVVAGKPGIAALSAAIEAIAERLADIRRRQGR